MMYGWGAKISRCQCNTIFAKGAEAKVGKSIPRHKTFLLLGTVAISLNPTKEILLASLEGARC